MPSTLARPMARSFRRGAATDVTGTDVVSGHTASLEANMRRTLEVILSNDGPTVIAAKLVFDADDAVIADLFGLKLAPRSSGANEARWKQLLKLSPSQKTKAAIYAPDLRPDQRFQLGMKSKDPADVAIKAKGLTSDQRFQLGMKSKDPEHIGLLVAIHAPDLTPDQLAAANRHRHRHVERPRRHRGRHRQESISR